MRQPVDAPRLLSFLEALGMAASRDVTVYLTGGATALLHGWRPTTVDVDLKIVPEDDALLRALPRLKDELRLNVELAAPDDFLPELPGWRERSPSAGRFGRIAVFHYDLYAQALAKLERGHAQDLDDVREMTRRGLVRPPRLLELLSAIEPDLYRFPAVDRRSFRRAVEDFLKTVGG
jgi:hypothetical protein